MSFRDGENTIGFFKDGEVLKLETFRLTLKTTSNLNSGTIMVASAGKCEGKSVSVTKSVSLDALALKLRQSFLGWRLAAFLKVLQRSKGKSHAFAKDLSLIILHFDPLVFLDRH